MQHCIRVVSHVSFIDAVLLSLVSYALFADAGSRWLDAASEHAEKAWQ